MSMTYEIDGPILTIRQEKETDPGIITETMKQAVSDPNLQDQTVVLWDATDAPAQASAKKINMMLEGFGSISPKLLPCMAMVVSNELQFGVARMTQAYAEASGLRVACFYTEDEARDWLNEMVRG